MCKVLIGTILLCGIIRGGYLAIQQGFGYSNKNLFGDSGEISDIGIIPWVILRTGIYFSFIFLAFPERSVRIISPIWLPGMVGGIVTSLIFALILTLFFRKTTGLMKKIIGVGIFWAGIGGILFKSGFGVLISLPFFLSFCGSIVVVKRLIGMLFNEEVRGCVYEMVNEIAGDVIMIGIFNTVFR